jgi:hypothetical protein
MGVDRVDPLRPSDLYAGASYIGYWKSTDYGVTWTMIENGSNVGCGVQWGGDIAPAPNRDPSEPPILYATSGYCRLGLWKSTDGGANWTQTWDNNIYDSDGVTNISGDVGADVCWVRFPDSTDGDNIVVSMHSYWGSGGHNGLFQTLDGGGKWKFIDVPFEFSPHGAVFNVIDKNTWIVSDDGLWRTTDAGATWHKASSLNIRPWGVKKVGSAIYATSEGGVAKSTDNGASWVHLRGSERSTSIAVTGTKIYSSYGLWSHWGILYRQASLSNDESWSNWPTTQGMTTGGWDCMSTFDGEHWIIISGNWSDGLWRYVEP